MNARKILAAYRLRTPMHFGLASLIVFHIVICCVSLIYVSQYHPAFHIYFDPARRSTAIVEVATFALLSYLFIVADFSFGYFVGFYFYTMVVGYLWITWFSDLPYNHALGALSAVASAVAFLIPALFISSPIRRVFVITTRAFERLLSLILVSAAATILVSAIYSFRLVSLGDIYDFRSDIEIPVLLNYWIGITSTALLPFAFGCFAIRRNYWPAGIVLALLLLFYPITLSKVAFFTPAWLLTLAVLSRVFEARTAVVLSLLLPMLAGLAAIVPFKKAAKPFFDLINLRMVAIPSNALDIYSDFFSNHELTHFCQIGILKSLMDCPYQDQLSIVMAKTYALGNFNASLFSTEGVASVGLLFAPVSVFICGLLFAFANRLSSGLPTRFILISGGIFPQILLNVPLTITMLTHGAAVLFLLWYITPRAIFDNGQASRPLSRGD
jgi:hypothetical protein